MTRKEAHDLRVFREMGRYCRERGWKPPHTLGFWRFLEVLYVAHDRARGAL